jgi:hypothetical protein
MLRWQPRCGSRHAALADDSSIDGPPVRESFMLARIAAVLTQNLTTKLLALLLAVVVYAHVATEAEQIAEIRIPLQVSGLSSDLVLATAPPAHARVAVRGRGKQLFKLRLEPPAVTLDLSTVRPGSVQRVLSPGDVALPFGSDVTVTEIVEPRRVDLVVDTLVVRSLPVRLIPTRAVSKGWARQPSAEPPIVSFRGPAGVLARLQAAEARFDPRDLAAEEGDSTAPTIRLEVPIAAPPGVSSQPDRVTALFSLPGRESGT